MLEPFTLPFVQRGLVVVAFLALAGGLAGTWIVLRGLAFYSHAVGTAAFPGLVLADGLGFAAHLGAGATAAAVAIGVGWLSRRDVYRDRYDSSTALILVGALVLGVVLASDVFRSGANIETLLFGSLLIVDAGDIAWAATAAAAVAAGSLLLGHRWLATGFDASTARALGVRPAIPDAVLLALVSLVSVAALSAAGALLAGALLVVPAATARLVCSRMSTWQALAVVLAALEGTAGLWLSVKLNAPPGAAIALLSGAMFAVFGIARLLASGRSARLVAPAAATAVLLAGCADSGNQTGQASPGAVPVVATTTQLGDFVREVGGRDVEVAQILRPNTDPHDYEPRPRDVSSTAGAKLVFENGNDLDAWMGKVVERSGGKPTVVVVGNRVPQRVGGETTGPEASRYDPHWWHDPRNARAAVLAVRDALTATKPGAKAAYEKNAASYLSRLGRLDRGIRRCFASIPAAQRKLVTDHDTFGYFAKRYGIEVIGAVIPSQSTQAQPSAGELSKLSALIRRERVRAVFPESSINPRLARALGRQSGASANYTLYGDTLGPKGSPGATYIDMERANADAMVRGFSGGRRGCAVRGL